MTYDAMVKLAIDNQKSHRSVGMRLTYSHHPGSLSPQRAGYAQTQPEHRLGAQPYPTIHSLLLGNYHALLRQRISSCYYTSYPSD